jgi:hypothetical protein
MEPTALNPAQDHFTQNDFIHGRPEKIIQATKSPKILIVWPHGNEESGPRLGPHIYTARPDLLTHVDYICGNPRAAAQIPAANYIDDDLNRSFHPELKANHYEAQRATEIRAQMQQGGYDYILVLHTSVTDIGKFLIIGSVTIGAREIIAASNFNRVVVMPTDIINTSASGQSPRAVEFEMNEKIAEKPETIAEFTQLIDRLIGQAPPQPPKPREVFYVDGTIPKSQDPGLDVPNFKLCHAGYYPVLMGVGKHSYRENPHKDYVGFAASRMETLIL